LTAGAVLMGMKRFPEVNGFYHHLRPSLRAKRSNPGQHPAVSPDCFVPLRGQPVHALFARERVVRNDD
jgi:hypothetical protein